MTPDPKGISRPPDATRKALTQCLEWLEACRRLGWREEDMDNLELLWWRYHDREGRRAE
jgi:hypothetical protein